MDASDYHGSLHTRHDFGCIEHKASLEGPNA